MERARQLLRQGRHREALEAAREDYDPADRQSRLVRGLAAAFAGSREEAKQELESALNPGEGQAQHWRVLAAVKAEQGDHAGEAAALREAVALAPDDTSLRLLLAKALLDAGQREPALDVAAQVLETQDSIAARRLFVDALGPEPRHRELLKRAVAEAWGRHPRLFGPALSVVRAEGDLEHNDLLVELLKGGAVRDAELERDLTALRRRYLLEEPGPLLEALSVQGWINEYCWRVSPEEAEALAALPPDSPLRALYDETGPSPDPVHVPQLTPIRGGVSAEVRAMYEHNPYPRWIRLPEQERLPIETVLRAVLPLAPIEPVPGSDILVAGCGTGQHALQVARRFEGQVLAVDLSRASLSYAVRKAQELGVTNVTFGQADLLELDGRFDLISCAGTLQAMADPYEGLAALLRMLKPGGVLSLGLYSRKAREELAPAMALARAFAPTRDGIRALRAAIVDAPEGDPVRAGLGWNDFYATSTVRDLLMHVMEHQSDFSDIRRMTAGLRFLGFQAPAGVLAGYRRENPGDPAGLDLGRWEAFEQRHPTIFRGMYQFWAQKPAG